VSADPRGRKDVLQAFGNPTQYRPVNI